MNIFKFRVGGPIEELFYLPWGRGGGGLVPKWVFHGVHSYPTLYPGMYNIFSKHIEKIWFQSMNGIKSQDQKRIPATTCSMANESIRKKERESSLSYKWQCLLCLLLSIYFIWLFGLEQTTTIQSCFLRVDPLTRDLGLPSTCM